MNMTKDEQITALKTMNDALERANQELTAENNAMRERLESLDRMIDESRDELLSRIKTAQDDPFIWVYAFANNIRKRVEEAE